MLENNVDDNIIIKYTNINLDTLNKIKKEID